MCGRCPDKKEHDIDSIRGANTQQAKERGGKGKREILTQLLGHWTKGLLILFLIMLVGRWEMGMNWHIPPLGAMRAKKKFTPHSLHWIIFPCFIQQPSLPLFFSPLLWIAGISVMFDEKGEKLGRPQFHLFPSQWRRCWMRSLWRLVCSDPFKRYERESNLMHCYRDVYHDSIYCDFYLLYHLDDLYHSPTCVVNCENDPHQIH